MDNQLEKTIDGQLYWYYTKLSNWEKNNATRIITALNWEKMVDDLKTRGVEDEFEIGPDGVTYDGNNRLKVSRLLIAQGILSAANGKSLEWIPVHINNPQSEGEKWALALRKNGHFASWNENALMNYQPEFQGHVDIATTNIQLSSPISIGERLTEQAEEKAKGQEESEKSESKSGKEQTCPNCGHKFVA